MAITRRVIGPDGNMMDMTFPEKSKSTESDTVKIVVPKSEPSTNNSTEPNEAESLTLTTTVESINAMELVDLRLLANSHGIKLGRLGEKKAKVMLIKELGLDPEVEL